MGQRGNPTITVAEYRAQGKKAQVKGRVTHRVPGEMNKTEQAFADLCQDQKLSGVLHDWRYEAITLKIALHMRYTPDFMLFEVATSSLVLVEVKAAYKNKETDKLQTLGYADSLVKLKMAAELFPFFEFRLAVRGPDKTWAVTVVKNNYADAS